MIKVSKDKTKLNCCLVTKGTEQADASASDDLSVPDPEPAIGKKIIQEAMKGEEEDGSESDCS